MNTMQWTNANRYRRYPFVDDTALDLYVVSGGSAVSATLGTNVLIDFECVHYWLTEFNVIVYFIDVTATSCRFYVKAIKDAYETLVTFDVPASAAFPYAVRLSTANQFRMDALFGEGILDLVSLTPGRYYFNTPAHILPCRLIGQGKNRVTSIAGSLEDSIRLRDDVYFEEGYNVGVAVDTSNNVLTLTAAVGLGKGPYCGVVPGTRLPGGVVRRINDIAPDASGNILLEGMDGIDITPGVNELAIRMGGDLSILGCNK